MVSLHTDTKISGNDEVPGMDSLKTVPSKILKI